MKIALVDDEAYQLELLKNTITASLEQMGFKAAVIDCFNSDTAFLENFVKDKYDIIVLDIYMGSANGVDVAHKIREVDSDVSLAFCTSSNEYAQQSYDVNASYYLHKPIEQDKVDIMLSRFNLAKRERNRSVVLPDGHSVSVRHIIYTEYINHRVHFHIKGISKPHIIYMTQSEVEALLLEHKEFCVVNKGSIVNFANVQHIENSAFLMLNGDVVTIPRRRLKELDSLYTKYCFEKLDSEVYD